MNRLPIVILAIATLMAPATLARGQQALTKDKIIGTWKLLSFYDESVDSGKKANVFGENPRGYLRSGMWPLGGNRKPRGPDDPPWDEAHGHHDNMPVSGELFQTV